ncbi:hypothetical protein J1605_013904 [Eschrichtius robustus]|uniref:Protein tyrosine phosphatase type IVA 3 n=1 Tax=Eschrichtius robustus TaxID=9764 RepID=A0AB34GF12_ESCRO|nr:hypothetical protein J1605_013904 [Eschrichtius robustus]MBW03869.1 Protein tyrosine phosphatase type IVA 3 [Eschrichtius robustus]
MARMNRPAPVEVSYKNMRFLITHNPTNATLSSFIASWCEDCGGISWARWGLQGGQRESTLHEQRQVQRQEEKRASPPQDVTCGRGSPEPFAGRSASVQRLSEGGGRVPQDLKKYGATTVVRVCEVTYDKAPLEKDGITVVDWPFDDGAPPPGRVVEDWLSLLKTKFCDDPGSCVAVHCVAGLGRAPVLVALALIESGMKYEDAIQFIRQKRRGAINSKQLTYLEKYRPKQRLRFKDPHAHKTKCCVM